MSHPATHRRLHTIFGLKWNPFLASTPADALYRDPRLTSFLRRVESLVDHGGYALVTGSVGSGKSTALRILRHELQDIPDVTCAVLTRPHCAVNDFYRELGDLFGVTLNPCNRWGGAKTLRERWLGHVEDSGKRAVVLIDEAQAMKEQVLQELRLLASHELDSQNLLTILIAGDERLLLQLQTAELLPLASRIRVRLQLESRTPEQLRHVLDHLLDQSGAPHLVVEPVRDALASHAGGNLRSLMNLGAELLQEALRREAKAIDETLFFEVFESLGVSRPRVSKPRSRS